MFDQAEPARTSSALVTFKPGARTAWHTHPLGQHLIVLSGCGWTQCWGGPKKEIRAGDVVFCDCGKKHWHGATDTTAMSHIAVQEWLNGTPVNWLEKVSDDQYLTLLEPDELDSSVLKPPILTSHSAVQNSDLVLSSPFCIFKSKHLTADKKILKISRLNSYIYWY